MTEQNGKTARKKQLIVNAFVEMCELYETIVILEEARWLIKV